MMDKEQGELDSALDAALAKYAAVEPRAGLEDRVLANLRIEQARMPVRAWWRWSVAGALAAVVFVALALAWRPFKPSPASVENHSSELQMGRYPAMKRVRGWNERGTCARNECEGQSRGTSPASPAFLSHGFESTQARSVSVAAAAQRAGKASAELRRSVSRTCCVGGAGVDWGAPSRPAQRGGHLPFRRRDRGFERSE